MINWMSFVAVAGTTLLGAGFVVTMYSLGVRFTAVSGDDDGRVNHAARWGSYICFGFCVLAVVMAIVLIVPFLSDNFFELLNHLF
ncbi:hypothetical protein [Arthrobacter psychrolactophilus]|uniref:hypothetical protein n=1 Tax=Arthrobacter psychrolactophilus TaxID=92442 RepID=UPI001FEB00D5|nr:hypothetical protein [Arthrobacter psychrolactophilus]